MLKAWFSLLVFLTLIVSARADENVSALNLKPNSIRKSSLIRPNALSIEMGGRGGLYSLNYDRALGSMMSLGIGYSYMDVKLSPVNTTGHVELMMIPIYSNIYFFGNQHRPFFTGGVSLIHINAKAGVEQKAIEIKNDSFPGLGGTYLLGQDVDVTASATLPIPILGLGYEYRSYTGILFRIAPYVTYITKLNTWGGMSLGGTF